jgi:hypothetical protein
MAFLINNTPVIDNSRNLANIASFDSTVASTWDLVTTTSVNKILVNREYCSVTVSGVTVTLPQVLNPASSSGWEVLISVGNFSNTIVNVNGGTIMSLAENMTIDSSYASVRLTYVDATRGWVIT